MNKEVRKLVWKRSKGYCEKCGLSINGVDWAFHHRKLKSQGGKDSVSNGLALHNSCHNIAKNSVHQNPKEADEKGYIVKSWESPDKKPLLRPNGTWVYLDDLGNYINTHEVTDDVTVTP